MMKLLFCLGVCLCTLFGTAQIQSNESIDEIDMYKPADDSLELLMLSNERKVESIIMKGFTITCVTILAIVGSPVIGICLVGAGGLAISTTLDIMSVAYLKKYMKSIEHDSRRF